MNLKISDMKLLVTRVLFSLTFIGAVNLYAQNNCYDDLLKTPDGFDSYIRFQDFKKINSDYSFLAKKIKKGQKSNPYPWTVFSDRKANRLYLSSDIGDVLPGETLDFLEPLYVLDHENSWLKVVRKSDFDCDDYPDSYWVNIDNLILNSFALTNELNNPRKGMILVSVENLASNKLEDLQEGMDLDKKFFYDPTLKRITNKEAKKFEIYFILKVTDSGKILLSSSDDLTNISDSPKELDAAVKGWVSDDIVTFWDSKVCLEVVSQEANELAYLDYKNSPIPVYKYQSGIKNFLNESERASVNNNECIKLSTPQSKRPSAYIPRMPILENYTFSSTNGKTLEYHKVACIAGMDSDQKDENIAEITRKVQMIKKRMNNIDILFVVDATKSMKKYFPTISKAIDDIITEQNKKNSNVNLRFGLSLYRHKLDGELACETIPLSESPRKILTKLNQEGICSSVNPKNNESQFNGIITGIDRARFNKEHSNLMILIGDCGNDMNDGYGFSIDDVVAKVNSKNINVVSFQVRGGESSYYDFKDNIQDILKLSAKRAQNGAFESQVDLVKSDNIDNTKILTFNNFISSENAAFAPKFGRYSYASGTREMPVKILKVNIQQSTKNYLSKIQDVRAGLEEILDGNSNKTGEKFTPETIQILKSPPYNFSDEQIKLLQDQGDISMMGYTSLNLYGNNSDAFIHSAFMTSAEHRILRDLYADLYYSISNSNSTQLRLDFQDQMIQLTKQFIDPNMDNKVILDKSFGQVWNELTGLPLKSNLFKSISKIKLKDLTVKKSLSDKHFYKFIDAIEPNLLSFSEGSGHSKFKWDKNGTSYYFLPIELIPGW